MKAVVFFNDSYTQDDWHQIVSDQHRPKCLIGFQTGAVVSEKTAHGPLTWWTTL
jgi:hypothetical protein